MTTVYVKWINENHDGPRLAILTKVEYDVLDTEDKPCYDPIRLKLGRQYRVYYLSLHGMKAIKLKTFRTRDEAVLYCAGQFTEFWEEPPTLNGKTMDVEAAGSMDQNINFDDGGYFIISSSSNVISLCADYDDKWIV